MYLRYLGLLMMTGLLTACASIRGMHEQFAVCSYDNAWEAALDAVKDRSISTKDKEAGLIVTGWLEIPMPGRTYGILQRELADSKDRSRLTLALKRLEDVTKIGFAEERQRWAFRGGSRLFGWAETEPSEDVRRDVQNRLDAKLKERGCSLT
jgi:hypothetical protein